MARISVATRGRLPSSLRVDSSNPSVQKCLNRLSRETLISLALDWLDDRNISSAMPYLQNPDEDEDEDMDDVYPPCASFEELQQLYLDMQDRKGSKRDVASRILEGDWRHGLTLYQIAMADLAFFDEHPTSQKWSAYQILPLQTPAQDAGDEHVLKVDKKSLKVPRFHPSTFLQNLQEQVLPDVKAHYHFHRPKDLPVLLLRVFVVDSPYNTDLALSGRDTAGISTNFDSSRTVYIAFPDGSPALYITKSQSTGPISAGESKSLRSLIIDGVPKALSRPRERYKLKPTSLVSKNLHALLEKKGSGRTNAAGGGWSIYADEKNRKSPLDTVLPTRPISSTVSLNRKRGPPISERERVLKRAKLVAKARFGDSGVITDGKGIERVDIVIQDPFPTTQTSQDEDEEDGADDQEAIESRAKRRRSKIDAAIKEAHAPEDEGGDGAAQQPGRWTPTIKISFQGPHVWAGIRQLVEAGIVDGERMPGWMTGEEGVTTGLVKQGRIRGHKGSGI